MALSVDGLFVKETGEAGTGMVLRDSKGVVTVLAYKFQFHCNDALEAKISVMMERIALTLQQS